MEPKPRLFKRAASPAGRICSPPPGLTSAGPCCCPDGSPPAAGLHCGLIAPYKPPPPAAGNAVYTVLVGDASLRRRGRRRSCEDGSGGGKSPPGKGRLQVLQKSPTHCNGRVLSGEAEPGNGRPRHLSEPLVLKQPEEETSALQLLDQTPLRHSPYIPVPRQRKLPEKAGIDEVMAAAVLTSLSTSPVVLNNPPSGFGAETSCDTWKEAPAMSSSCSSSSNNSGDWSWDPPSDLSTPSTPSPPLSTDIATGFLSSLQSDIEETEATHFLFGDPIPRKRKNSTKVMFKCLWKNCGKVLSSSSGMQKHIRTTHLGRKADLDQSDGEEDFYYTELDINVDSLTDGLSSLTPVSPTSSVPPAFPILEEAQAVPPVPVKPEAPMVSPLNLSAATTILSQSAPTSLCHIQTDHAYQGCLTPIRPADVGERRPQVSPMPIAKGHPLVPPSMPKPTTGTRKPRGEAKKCRKVYGMENRSMWCTACRWKKACQRFVD
ncbi:SLC2A4 regulator isoform X2 [Eublepharis macularius]|uniref:SLC2A4 regulator isoform X2 n=1 Tax=Eublepharis macularius TaxID=481883 RepID=A0AA97L082_EUBMA|nr:SLC2A4 regulator isoform X2 [Eublepharis macularius]